MSRLQLYAILFIVTNVIFHIQAQYVGQIISPEDRKAVLKQSMKLQCTYTGSEGNGEFIGWYKDGVDVNTEKPGHYAVSTTDKETVLTIKIFVIADANVSKWEVKTNKEPSACVFESLQVKPSPQGISTNRESEKLDSHHGSVRRSEDTLVVFKCIIEPAISKSDENQITWQYSKDTKTYTNLPPGVIQADNTLTIGNVKKIHNGYYRCEMNDVQFAVLLRVKDRLAALWPFIGIVSVVIVLVIIIIIFEKRQKANKKSSTDDDEQDQANDPLVRTTANASDSDNKKRTVNA